METAKVTPEIKEEDERKDKLNLKRQVGLMNGVAFIVGCIIGSGIFVSPVGVLSITESVGMCLVIWFMCGVLAMLGSLSYAELGTMIPKSGGEYNYLYDTYGPPIGFIYAWVSVMLTRPASLSAIVYVFAQYAVEPFYDPPNCPAPASIIKTVAMAAVILLCFINCVSVRWATFIQSFFTVAKVLALLIIIGIGTVRICQGYTEYIKPSVAFQGSSPYVFAYGIAFYQGLWAYDGWNNLNYVVEELVNPYRNLPLGLVISLPSITIMYVLVNVCYFTVLSPKEMLISSAVALTFARRTLGVMAWIMPLFVCCSTLGSANGTLFTAGRLCYVSARQGHMLDILSMVSIKYRTPATSLMFTVLIPRHSIKNTAPLVKFSG